MAGIVEPSEDRRPGKGSHAPARAINRKTASHESGEISEGTAGPSVGV